MSDYKFYMQKVAWSKDKGDYVGIDGTLKDLEVDFLGLKYSKCVGLNNIGEHRVYKEEYADDERVRVYIPDVSINKATDVKLTLFFLGENRQDTFDEFNNYIMDGFSAYWDTCRKKKVYFYISQPIEPSNDVYKGSVPYIEATYTLSNVYGKTFNV